MMTRMSYLAALGCWALGMSILFENPAISLEISQPDPPRFQLLREYGDEGVLDTQTGLVWEQSPSPGRTIWYRAKSDCGVKVIRGSRGWRLPSFFELMTLVEPSIQGRTGTPLLPAGHPFKRLSEGVYWSSETHEQDPARAYVVDFLAGDVATREKATHAGLWCVKGSQAPSISREPAHQLIHWNSSLVSPTPLRNVH